MRPMTLAERIELARKRTKKYITPTYVYQTPRYVPSPETSPIRGEIITTESGSSGLFWIIAAVVVAVVAQVVVEEKMKSQ
jgi:hypothetical protein